MEKNKKRTKILSIIAILTIIGGVVNIFTSIPRYNLYTSINQGGITVKDRVRIVQVMPNSPGADAKLEVGDIIVSVNGQNINNSSDFIDISNANQGVITDILIERGGSSQSVQLIPRVNPPSNEGRVGITISDSGVEKKPIYQIVPLVIIRGYSGYEDRSFSRLQALVSGIIGVAVGFGLLKLKRWAMYGLFVVTCYSIILSIPYLINPESYISPQPVSQFIRDPIPTDPFIYIIGLITEVSFAVYVYMHKKLFKVINSD